MLFVYDWGAFMLESIWRALRIHTCASTQSHTSRVMSMQVHRSIPMKLKSP